MMSRESAVIKKEAVRMAGTHRLGPPAAAAAGAGKPVARITEQSGGTVVVEVTCACGKRIYLHCTCADSSGQAPPPGAAPG